MVMAATACDQLATRPRMPAAPSSSMVPMAAASRPDQKVAPAAHTPARCQKPSPVYQYSRSQPSVANTSAIGKCTSMVCSGWPMMATVELVSSASTSRMMRGWRLAADSDEVSRRAMA